MDGKFEVGIYGGNKATYLRMKSDKVSNDEFAGIIPDSDNYEGEINHIGISRERTRHPDEALTGEANSVLRSELGELMRIARPDSIYDASVATRTFTGGGANRCFGREGRQCGK